MHLILVYQPETCGETSKCGYLHYVNILSEKYDGPKGSLFFHIFGTSLHFTYFISVKFYSCVYKLLYIFTITLITKNVLFMFLKAFLYLFETSLQNFLKLLCGFLELLCKIMATCFSAKFCGDFCSRTWGKNRTGLVLKRDSVLM